MPGSSEPIRSSIDVKVDIELEETAPQRDPLLEDYDLIRDKTAEELKALDKSVIRKLDWNYLDRINVSNARLAGLQEDLRMSDTMWSAGISLFYVGYILSQVPANVIIAKASRESSSHAACWGGLA
ncbi:putative transporter C1683.12-like protein 20 [Colletotrichum chlorophyti]|uniref:Putative transporter C1683.12-like protein 20 n=1 Tax=Colletotrichum chlorophyti TaxID=708187 RepID=A0A1Q8RS39_9PEZI|nr:putative transporter C1683.12-like protein 20 [Colletotrichum chlorophyti]